MNIDFSFDCLIGSWHQGGFAKCYELKDLATGEVRNFLTKNWSCSSESEALLFRWLRERLCPNRSWPRVIRRSGLLKELLTRDSTLCLPGFTRGCRSCTWWSSSATSRTPTSCTLCWSFAGIVFASLLVVNLRIFLVNVGCLNCWFKKTCISTVCSQKEKSDGVAQEA